MFAQIRLDRGSHRIKYKINSPALCIFCRRNKIAISGIVGELLTGADKVVRAGMVIPTGDILKKARSILSSEFNFLSGHTDFFVPPANFRYKGTMFRTAFLALGCCACLLSCRTVAYASETTHSVAGVTPVFLSVGQVAYRLQLLPNKGGARDIAGEMPYNAYGINGKRIFRSLRSFGRWG